MRVFPIMLDIRGRTAVVVGGGPVGLRRARALGEAGARVRLIAGQAQIPDDINDVTVVHKPYRAKLLAGATIVFACTDDADLNTAIARDARRIGALVNVADCPDDCDFYMPAVTTDGDVVVAVSTGGAAPALAGKLRCDLTGALPRRVGDFAALLGTLRGQLQASEPDLARRRRIMKELCGDQAYAAFIEKGPDELRTRFKNLQKPFCGDKKNKTG